MKPKVVSGITESDYHIDELDENAPMCVVRFGGSDDSQT